MAATLSGFDLGSESRAIELVVSPTVTSKWPKGTGGPAGDEAQNLVTHALTSEGFDASEDGTGRGTPLVPVSLAVAGDFSTSEDVAQTVRAANGQPGTVLDVAVRRLTPRECERLQGFPDDWTLTSNGREQSDSARYRQMGNAVAVPVAEWILRRLVGVDALTCEDAS